MSKVDTGGHVFATQLHKNFDGFAVDGGITLRDYFAAKAMMSLYLSGLEWEPTGKPRDPEHMIILEELAVDSYQFADAMLKARNGNS